MKGKSGKIEFNLRNTINDISISQIFIRRFSEGSGLPDRESYILNLAYEELATNIVKYAFDDDCEHWIKVLLESNVKGVFLTFMDNGRAFDPCGMAEPEYAVSEEQVICSGLFLVKKMTRGMNYIREKGWNILKVQI